MYVEDGISYGEKLERAREIRARADEIIADLEAKLNETETENKSNSNILGALLLIGTALIIAYRTLPKRKGQ